MYGSRSYFKMSINLFPITVLIFILSNWSCCLHSMTIYTLSTAITYVPKVLKLFIEQHLGSYRAAPGVL